MRTTKKDLEIMFKRLVRSLYKNIDRGSHKGFYLDYIACYGGYVIIEYLENGGEHHPFGCLRRSAKDMYSSMRMACEALDLIKIN